MEIEKSWFEFYQNRNLTEQAEKASKRINELKTTLGF